MASAWVSPLRRREGRGLVMTNPGGGLGWLTRRYFPRLSTRAYLYYIRLIRAAATRRRIAEFAKSFPPPWFDHVEIETVNRCNGECSFCPVNRRDDPRPYRLMPESLFERLLGQLSDIGYSGYLGLFSNNEPLLDKRLPVFAAEARRALPDAYLSLSTNGRLLDPALFRALIASFDRIVINNYRDKPELYGNIRDISDYCLSGEGQPLLAGKTVEISLRDSRDVLTSRAGTAPNRPPPAKPLTIPCSLPFSQLVIRPDGGVSLCCNDALGRMTLGETDTQSLREIWYGPAYTALRKIMAERGREALSPCDACDFVKRELE